jgi:hypothetical protein
MCAFGIIVPEAVFINICSAVQIKIPPKQKYIISISQNVFLLKIFFEKLKQFRHFNIKWARYFYIFGVAICGIKVLK